IGQWANAFGPSLMRDLLRQVKTLYPDAERIGGYRVSGARQGAADTTWVRLDAADSDMRQKLGSILTDAWRPITDGTEANIVPSEMYTAHETELAGAIHDEIGRITGGRAKVQPSAGIRYKGHTPQGMYFDRAPLILYDLLGDDPMGTARHEAMHFLRHEGLFTDAEWQTLTKAAQEEGWAQRYGIDRRYDEIYAGRKDLDELKNEESIVEAFREWAAQPEHARRAYSPVAQIFQKLREFLQRIHDRFAEILGHEPTADELFQRVSSGDIGNRARQGTGGTAGEPLFSIDELDNLKASGLGLDLKSFQRIQSLVQERYRRDVEASLRHAEKEQAKRQTQEWKDNKASMAQDIETTIRQRPDVAADLFIGSGELYGEKLQQRFTLRSGDLTEEQRAALPAHYVSKNGLPVDDVAKLFGYGSGDAMVERMAAYNALKDGKSPQEMLRHAVDLEADRQMEAKYGNLGENILSEAQSQAMSENDLNLLTEEYHAAAQSAGVATVGKEEIQERARDLVDQLPLNEVSFDKAMAKIGPHYRDAVRALVAGDAQTAVQALQRRTLAAHVAAEMRKVETAQGKFNRVAKRYAKPWDPTKSASVSPDFSLFTRDILSRVGLRYGMSVPGLAKAISESAFKGGLQDFVEKTEAETASKISGLELPVPDWLMAQTQPQSIATMKVAQAREVWDAVTVMDKIGRADQKIIKAGEARDRAEWVAQAREQLKQKFEP